MNKELFLDIIKINQDIDNEISSLSKLGIDIIDNKIVSNIYKLINSIIKNEYGKTGDDWYSWWICELPSLKEKHPEQPHAWDKNNNPIVLDTPEQFYEFLENLKNNE
jgi:hypothetical protein